jgi:hypothetical protein
VIKAILINYIVHCMRMSTLICLTYRRINSCVCHLILQVNQEEEPKVNVIIHTTSASNEVPSSYHRSSEYKSGHRERERERERERDGGRRLQCMASLDILSRAGKQW